MLAPSNDFDEYMIRRAIRLAMNGRGNVEPNPMVGCVIVKDGRVIGEGFHAKFGEAHAEPTALANCTESPEGATAYVTLEPCCHTNKKTPPCAPRLIAAKIARVVIGCLDPNPDVDGKGIAMLREAGIDVTPGVLEAAAKQLIAPFIAYTTQRRPYVTLKWAETADGKIAGPGGKRLQISGLTANRAVHHLRAASDRILVGINTVLNDDPQLTPRDITVLRDTVPVVLDTHLRIPITSRLVDAGGEGSLLVYHCASAPAKAVQRLHENRIALIETSIDAHGRVLIAEVLKDLHRAYATHVIVEPGPTLARSFFDENLVDRLWVIRSPMRVEDDTASNAAAVPSNYILTGIVDLAADTLTEYLNPASPAFFAPEPSADFVLAHDRVLHPLPHPRPSV